ncbi:MAG TPA: YaaC family protein [Cerasibacillus sp.]|uniref:YaaC family protein n=1 Tax=Cerasibacillus sp. TaxID=2498711 RepID=UPI002F3F05D9
MHIDDETILIYLTSQETAQSFLHRVYERSEALKEIADVKSYENCHSFMYYLDHGRKLFNAGHQVDIIFQPTLYFYGMGHFMKALILTERPHYPESTSMMAHGVSSRKRKKKAYTFLDDEVKIQHQGLLPYFSEHVLSMNRLPFEKIKMLYLCSLVPELQSLFLLTQDPKLVKIPFKKQKLTFPSMLLDRYHMTAHTFINRIKPFLPHILETNITKSTIEITLAKQLSEYNTPFFFDKNEQIYFPASRDIFYPISEIIIHYLLLYNLSMLSRYEAGWWGDLIVTKADIDYPFIVKFLEITAWKVPYLFEKALQNKFFNP